MSHMVNDKAQEAAWKALADLWDTGNTEHVNSWGEYCPTLNLLTESYDGCDGEYINLDQLEEFFEILWTYDADLLCRDAKACVESYLIS